MANSPATASQEVSPAFTFVETPKVSLCTVMACAAGHEWSPTLQLAQCPGCQSPILAIKMVNCPQCNEPSTTLALRADHLSRGSPITNICRGSESLAEVHKIQLNLNHAALEQEKHVEREMPSKI